MGEGICTVSVSTSACMNDSVRCYNEFRGLSMDCIGNDLTVVLSTLMFGRYRPLTLLRPYLGSWF